MQIAAPGAKPPRRALDAYRTGEADGPGDEFVCGLIGEQPWSDVGMQTTRTTRRIPARAHRAMTAAERTDHPLGWVVYKTHHLKVPLNVRPQAGPIQGRLVSIGSRSILRERIVELQLEARRFRTTYAGPYHHGHPPPTHRLLRKAKPKCHTRGKEGQRVMDRAMTVFCLRQHQQGWRCRT